MVPVSWHVHVRWHNCGLHPLIHTFPTRKLNTKCGIMFFRDKVWIKVWQVNSQGKVRGLRLTQSYSF